MQRLLRRQIVFTLILLGFALASSGQRNYNYWDEKVINFGFLVGLNTSTFYTIESPNYVRNDSMMTILPSNIPGIQFGFVLPNFKMTRHLSLRFLPGMTFAGREIQYSFQDPRQDRIKKVNSVYVDLPVSLKLRSDLIANSYRVYVTSGGRYSLDFASRAKVVDDFQQIKIVQPDILFDVGIGFEMYFPYFKLSPELRLSTGISNVLVREGHQFSSALEQLRTRNWMISFYFE